MIYYQNLESTQNHKLRTANHTELKKIGKISEVRKITIKKLTSSGNAVVVPDVSLNR